MNGVIENGKIKWFCNKCQSHQVGNYHCGSCFNTILSNPISIRIVWVKRKKSKLIHAKQSYSEYLKLCSNRSLK